MAEKKTTPSKSKTSTKKKVTKKTEEKQHKHISKRLIFWTLMLPIMSTIIFAMVAFMLMHLEGVKLDRDVRFAFAKARIYEAAEDFYVLEEKVESLEEENDQLKEQVKDNIEIVINPSGVPEIVEPNEVCPTQDLDLPYADLSVDCNWSVRLEEGVDRAEQLSSFSTTYRVGVNNGPMTVIYNTDADPTLVDVSFIPVLEDDSYYSATLVKDYLSAFGLVETGVYQSASGENFVVATQDSPLGVFVYYVAEKQFENSGSQVTVLSVVDSSKFNEESLVKVVDTFSWDESVAPEFLY